MGINAGRGTAVKQKKSDEKNVWKNIFGWKVFENVAQETDIQVSSSLLLH